MKNHILLIDDEANIRDLLSRYLTGLGYRVTTTGTVREGLQTARQEQPDLLISDLQLEDGDGLEMIGELKGDYPNLPVILLTGVLFDREVVDQVLSNKVSCYLEKTSSLAKINETVRTLLPLPA
ncbi:MAG: response regulator [Cephaloticoccus sp.]|nr:response regulator [Cephaloticoccus sp.]MCF7759537.1 response regulator [Cephaloticoccus sp.]